MKIIESAKILVGTRISEIDMIDAGTSTIKDLKLLSPSEISILNSIPKKERSKYIGLLTKNKYKTLAKKVTEGIKEAVTLLLKKNNIEQHSILTIRRDAAFIIGPPPLDLGPWPELGLHRRFRNASTYSSSVTFKHLEFLANPDKRTFSLKGISDENTLLHKDYFIEFLLDFLFLLSNKQTEKEAYLLIKEFKKDYCSRKTPMEFFRTFNAESKFLLYDKDLAFYLGNINLKNKNDINIAYNFNTIILPLINALL